MTNHDSKKVADRLQKFFRAKGLKASAVARITGIPAGTLSRYLNGKLKPHQKNIFTLWKHLGLNSHWLLTGEGDMGLAFTDPGYKPPPVETERAIRVEEPPTSYAPNGTGMLTIGDVVQHIQSRGTNAQRARLRQAKQRFMKSALEIAEEIDSEEKIKIDT